MSKMAGVKRKRSQSAFRRGKRGKRSFSKRRVMRSMARSSFTAAVHPHHRWALPSVYNNGTKVGSFNFDGTTTTYNATTGVWGNIVGATTSAVTEMDGALTFELNDMPDVSEFSNLYDQYKILAVKVTIKMLNVPEAYFDTNHNTNNFDNNWYPTIWYAPDHDDNSYQTVAQLREYSRVKHKTLRPNRELSIMLKPSILRQVYNGTSTGYVPEFGRPWLDMANLTLPHFGLKFAIDFEGLTTASALNGSPFGFRFNVKYYFMCKNAR